MAYIYRKYIEVEGNRLVLWAEESIKNVKWISDRILYQQLDWNTITDWLGESKVRSAYSAQKDKDSEVWFSTYHSRYVLQGARSAQATSKSRSA